MARNRYLSTPEAAERLKIHPSRIRRLAAAGRIQGAQKIGRDWIIPESLRIRAGSRGPQGTWEQAIPDRKPKPLAGQRV